MTSPGAARRRRLQAVVVVTARLSVNIDKNPKYRIKRQKNSTQRCRPAPTPQRAWPCLQAVARRARFAAETTTQLSSKKQPLAPMLSRCQPRFPAQRPPGAILRRVFIF